ncbi:polyphosphate kinase 1 [Taibaiella lutea]|uniref:Polyphosphate kinase n=1 Tax=Taibaiella lutea TaxID=2608001 RepID=A0A5M6CN45_9BACT|nr:polyphosphate kinase 1 [Taibaiella lutea]KAA5536477.1 polyphosphate kinase 1 [Taibaiella lutea]
MENRFNNRDVSWLYFNERVMLQASKTDVPLMERFRFLSIFSSNLDEFYRVRMPAIRALQQIKDENNELLLKEIDNIIKNQQQSFGQILNKELLPLLHAANIHFVYREKMPEVMMEKTKEFMLNKISAFLQLIWLSEHPNFFPESNKIYLAFACQHKSMDDVLIINIPAEECGRFYTETINGIQYIVTIDDIIKTHLAEMLNGIELQEVYSFKITRDADLELHDEFKGDIALKIEEQIAVRDFGLATRFLYDASMSASLKQKLMTAFQLQAATLVEGGAYHNLKDLSGLPLRNETFNYLPWKAKHFPLPCGSMFECLEKGDILVSVPYQSYERVLQFFNAAAIDPYVTEISITLYRIAGDSVIANALISAAKNGKQVTVFVELKARFDEANNIRWAKKMKAAGVKIIYSIPGLKVHAKVALVKRKLNDRSTYYGVFSTGNFNESTARFYTDHILLTCNNDMLREAEMLFIFLAKRRKPLINDTFGFRHLLIAQFNLQSEFLKHIEQEIQHARQGLPAAVFIKLNNLEEEVLINKLYEASAAGVKINLIVRSICRVRPGVKDLSENITVRRIVDRYLEHPRIFVFHNNGNQKTFLGSADWMNRNIYRRIEVCFPLYDNKLKQQIWKLLEMQWQDTAAAVSIDENARNIPLVAGNAPLISSQETIFNFFQNQVYE